MIIKNQSAAWNKPFVNIKKLSGLIIAYGGLKTGIRGLVDDYLKDYQELKCPALINNKTGKRIEDFYDDSISDGSIIPIDHEIFRDVADYILDSLLAERRGSTILPSEFDRVAENHERQLLTEINERGK